jgi:hypothetical protein
VAKIKEFIFYEQQKKGVCKKILLSIRKKFSDLDKMDKFHDLLENEPVNNKN